MIPSSTPIKFVRLPPSPLSGGVGLTPPAAGTLLADVRELITTARDVTAQAVNSALVLLHWQVGTRVRSEALKESRAGYGEQIVPTLSRELEAEFERGFS